MRAARWMAAGLLLAGCSASGPARDGAAPPFVGRWDAPRGYTEFHADGRYEMVVTGGGRMTGTYTARGDSLLSIRYDQLPGRDVDAMRVAVVGDTLRLCDPERPRLPCATLLRAGR